MVSSLKHKIASNLFSAQANPQLLVFRKEGDKYIIESTFTGLQIIISKECVDFVIDEQCICIKVSDDIYKFVGIMYVMYRILPLAIFIKRIIKRLVSILK